MSGIILAIGNDVYSTVLKRYASKDEVGSGSITIENGGRNSSSALTVSISNASVFFGNCFYAIAAIPASNEIYDSFAFRINALPPTGSGLGIREWRDGSGIQARLTLNSDGSLSIAGLTSSGITILANTYYHCEVRLKIGAGDGIVHLKINEVDRIPMGGSLNTKGSASTDVTNVAYGLRPINNNVVGPFIIKFDDQVVRDDGFGGDCSVVESLPSGTGSQDDGVPTGDSDTQHCVDEPDPDDDTTFSALRNTNDKFLLTYPSLPSGVDIVAAGLLVYAKKAAAGTGKFKVAFKIAGNDHLSATEQAPSNTSYAYFQDLLMQNPDTSADWTNSEVNNMQIGCEKSA